MSSFFEGSRIKVEFSVDPIEQQVEPWKIKGGSGSKGYFWVKMDSDGLM